MTNARAENMLKEAAINELGFCNLCGKKSSCQCERCGDFYCSELCQRRDWPNHRFICFPMPKLIKVAQSSTSNKDTTKCPQQQVSAKNEKSSKTINLPPNGSCVVLTAFKSLNRCYIRSTNPSTVAEYEKNLLEINEFGKISATLSDKPIVNSYAIALRGDKWCRVKILGWVKSQCNVCFVDFGDISKRSLKELRKIMPSLENLPILIHLVQLKDVAAFSSHSSVMKSLMQYINKEYKIEFVQPHKAGGNVELFHWGTETSLNSAIQALFNNSKHSDKVTDNSVTSSSSIVDSQMNGKTDTKDSDMKSKQEKDSSEMNIKTNLKNTCNSITNNENINEEKSALEENKPNIVEKKMENSLPLKTSSASDTNSSAAPRQIKKPCLIPPFQCIPLNENEHNCKIIITDNTYIKNGYIGCLLEKYYGNLKDISMFLKQYDVGDQPYKPKLNEYCLASYEYEWYRAKVIEVLSEDKFLVVYIDFTNEQELTSNEIRRYPMSLNFPCCTTLCAIDGLPEELSEEMKNFLELSSTDFPLINIDSVRVVDDIPYVKSNELLNKMRDCKLL